MTPRAHAHRRIDTVHRALDGMRRRRARILAYHSVSPHRTDEWSVTPARFEQHLATIRDMGYTVMSLDAIAGRLVAGQAVGGLVALTFDDAYADFVEHAMPIIRDHAVPATLFVPVGLLGGVSSWSLRAPDAPLMTARQVELARLAGVAIGSHSFSHRRLPELGADELEGEIHDSWQWLKERLGEDRLAFAYPFGDFGPREREAVAGGGYVCAVGFGGLFGNGPDTDLFALNRDPILRSTDDRALRWRLRGWSDWIPVTGTAR